MAELDQLSLGRDPVVARLLSNSNSAKRAGNKKKAHDLLRQAASLAPYDEAVWWSLLDVVDNEPDRVACLENILAINPDNVEARRLQRLAHIGVDLNDLTPADPAQSFEPLPATVRPLPPQRTTKRQTQEVRRSPSLWRFFWLVIVFGLLAVALGIILSILIYGGLFS
ncbi:MAG: hypothetical protein IT320_06620 [Anaerolineae bacterium]|nr:hypothetical protein [Anaerolineae bacterium]